MTDLVSELAITIGGSFALSTIVKATVVAGAALIALSLTRRTSASIRHLLLAAAFLMLLALPVVSLAVPMRDVSVPVEPHASMRASNPTVPAPLSPDPRRSDDVRLPDTMPLRDSLSPMIVAFIGWLAVAAFMLGNILVGVMRVERLRRRARPFCRGQAVVAEVAARMSIRSRVQVLADDALVGPIACGVVRPAIVFPADADTWDSGELERAVTHELEHIRRGDWVIQCVARVTCALYWFHPLVWMSWRQLRVEAERACDDAVLLDTEPDVYAEQLVALAERLTLNRTGSALAMSSRFDLAARVSAVLDAHQRREPAGPRWKMSVTAVALLLLAVVAPLRAVAVHLVESTPTLAGAPRNSNIGTPRVAVGRWHDAAEPLFAPPSPSKVNGAPIVTFSLTSPDPAERAAAACQLGIPGDRSAVPQLVALLDDGAPLPPQIFCGTHPPFEDESWAPRYEEVFEPSPGEAATRALLAVGDAAIEALTDTLLRASHWRARKNAAWALAHRGHAVATLMTALNDPAWQVRAEAAYALFQRGSKDGDVVDALRAASKDVAWPVREQAVLALGSHARHSPQAAESLLVALRDTHPRVRLAATTTLWHSADGRLWSALFELLRDPDDEVRGSAARAAGNRALDADVQTLIAARNDPDPRMRDGVRQALLIAGQRMRGTSTNLTRVEIPRD